jgi:hypothetical protein
MYLFLAGEPLESVIQKFAMYQEILTKYKQEVGNYYMKVGYQAALNLSAKEVHDGFEVLQLNGTAFNENTDLELIKEYYLVFFIYYMWKELIAVLFGKFDEVIDTGCPWITAVG